MSRLKIGGISPKKSYYSLLLGLSQFSFSEKVYAAIPGLTLSGVGDVQNKLLCPVIDTMFWILITLSAVMVLWAAYMYVTAQDDSEKVSKAHKTIMYAAAAVVVALLAKGFPALIFSIFPSTGATTGYCP